MIFYYNNLLLIVIKIIWKKFENYRRNNEKCGSG